MTTIDQIRNRHDRTCAGPCDVDYLLAEIRRLQDNYACVMGMRAALIRARDELEVLTGESQPWIDAAMINEQPQP